MLTRLLATYPAVEVLGRLAYWRVAPLHRLGNAIRDRRARRARSAPATEPGTADFAAVIDALRDLGVHAGDILIVHSSFAALKPFGLSADEVIDRLRALLGPAGTLAMPTIPILRGEPEGLARHSDAAFDRVFDYDVGSTRIWTGALPKALMGVPGAVRSRCPGNAMVAVGTHAEAMMRDNLAGDFLTPSGPGSAWEYAHRHGAKVICLGVDLVHSLTMIHVAEESFPDRWTIPDWYRPRRYRIRDGEWTGEITLHERRHGWSQYYAERAFSHDLHRDCIAERRRVDGLEIAFCEARQLIAYLVGHPQPFYPYHFPFGIRSSGRTP